MQNKHDVRIKRIENSLLPERAQQEETPTWVSIAAEMERLKVANLSVAAVHDGQVEWAAGYGLLETGKPSPVNTETIFQAASVSKPVAAAAILCLVQRGILDLDADVNRYLKSWKVPDSNRWQPTITLRQLLSHTAGTSVPGFAGYEPGQPLPDLVQILNGQPPANSEPVVVTALPGAQYNYSGGGTTIAQLVCSDVLGATFDDIVREFVFEPLNMKRSFFEQPLSEARWENAALTHDGYGAVVTGGGNVYPELAAAGLWTSPTDLALFGIEFQKAAAGKGKILSSEMVEQMLTPHAKAFYHLDIGLGVYVARRDGGRMIYHNGFNRWGGKADWLIYLDAGMGAVVMSGAHNGFILSTEVFRSIAREYHWPEYDPPPRLRVPRSPQENYAMYAGAYRLENGLRLEVHDEGGQLYLRLDGQKPLELRPITGGETLFKVSQLHVECDFIINPATETVDLLYLAQNRQKIEAKRI